MADQPSSLRIEPGTPSRALALGILVAAALLLLRALASGDGSTDVNSPIAPQWIALFTLVGAVLLARRALTQAASVDDEGLVLRNLSSTARVHWSAVEALRVQRRLGVQTIDVTLRGSRRTLRVGAATRFDGPAATEVLAALGGHPSAAALLDVDEP